MAEQGSRVETADGNWYVLVVGLAAPQHPTALAPGLTLRPLEASLTVFDLAAAGAAGFREWAVLEPLAPACRCEIESAKDADVRPGYDTLNRAWLLSALLVLRGFSRHLGIACSGYSWSEIAGHQKRTAHVFRDQLREEGAERAVNAPRRALPAFRGNLLDFHLRMLVNTDARTSELTDEDVGWVNCYFDTFNRLASENDRFRLGLDAAIDWRYAKEARTAVARLWSGIEAIFGVSSELVFRTSLLSACLLEERGETRKLRFEAVKKLYGLRSKAVHGDVIGPEKLAEALTESFRLLRELLVLSVERGHVLDRSDFDEALFY